jgi:hypothetical protein
MRRLIFGDWGRVIRDPLDLIRLGFLIAAMAAAASGDLENTVRLLATFLIVLAARFLDLPRLFDLGVLVGMFLQAFGNAAGLFTSFRYYDLVVHFCLPLATAPCVYILLARLGVVPDLADAERRHRIGIFLVTFAIGFSIGAGYEIYEWIANHWLGASLKVGYADTIGDLADDALASALGGWLLVVWAVRGWGTTRRVPGRRLVVAGRPAVR